MAVVAYGTMAQTRTWIAVACAISGVFLLAGPGWALLAAAALLWLSPRSDRLSAGAVRLRAAAATGMSWLVTSRRTVAAAGMPFAIVLIVAGLGVVFGIGWAVFGAGVLVGALSLHLGWNAV